MFGSYLGVSDCFRRIRTSSSSTAAIFLKLPYYFIDEDVGETLFKGFLRAIMGLANAFKKRFIRSLRASGRCRVLNASGTAYRRIIR
jgi:hypothetical protein